MMEQTQQERPLLAEMVRRSSVDWGVAPKYNEEYRKIRWPAVVGGGKPMWISTTTYQRNRKQEGRWNTAGPAWTKPDTNRALHTDIRFCIRENIPFKTRTYEYRPHNQIFYVKGVPVLKYELETGRLEYFTYSGVYDKVISFFLRSFDINVKKIGRQLFWVSDTYGEVLINLHTHYTLEDPRIIRECSTIINHPLNREFTGEGITSTPRPWWRTGDTSGDVRVVENIEAPELTAIQQQVRNAIAEEITRLGTFPETGLNMRATLNPSTAENINFMTEHIRDALNRRNDQFEVTSTATEEDIRAGRLNIAIRVPAPVRVDYINLRATIRNDNVDWNF